jgi:LysM repeat protein
LPYNAIAEDMEKMPHAKSMQPKWHLWLIAVTLATLWAWGGYQHLSQAQGQLVHVVQAGENLFRIAARYGTTVDAIVAANDLADANQIQEGQRLIIPDSATGSALAGAAATTGGSYVVQPGDTLLYIALRYGLRLSELRQANGLFGSDLIYAGQALIIPGAGGTVPRPGPTDDTYIVQYGDTLPSIAEQYYVDAFALARANGLNTFTLRVGQLLRVSGPGLTPDKRIIVDLSEQHLDAYEGDRVVFSFVCSSGKAPYYTRTGEFHVQSKIPNAYGSSWDIWMPHWLGIYWAGGTENGIHALPILPNGTTLWAGYLGHPVSYGCIVLDTEDAKTLYDWAEMGTPVVIQP